MRLRRPFLELEGAVVVITGASSGIGRLTAHRLAGRGARLVLAARGRDALDAVVEECVSRGAEAIAAPTDVSDPASVRALATTAEERFGRIDGWINNAGVMAYGRVDKVPIESQRQVVETNLLGAMAGAHEALVHFRRREERGLLVNVSSLLGEMTVPWVSSYVTSKFGLIGFSRSIRRDYRPDRRIAVCCVLPSSMDTPIFRAAANYHGRQVKGIQPIADPDRVARVIERCFHRPRREVRVGWFGRFATLGEQLVPPIYDRVINRAFRVLGFRQEEQPATDGNLFEPLPQWEQTEGEWRRTGARWAAAVGAAAVGAAALVAAGLLRRR